MIKSAISALAERATSTLRDAVVRLDSVMGWTAPAPSPQQGSRASNALENLAVRLDGLVNTVTGFGTSLDKSTYSHFTRVRPISDEELSGLYHGCATARRMVDVVPQEMLREGYTSDVGDPDSNEWLSEKHRELDTRGKLIDGMRWGRLYGGSAILIGADDGRPAHQPLRADRVRSVRYLYVVDRRYLTPLTWYGDPAHPKFGEPETYHLSPQHGHVQHEGLQVVHESRLILFGGAPTDAMARQELGGWDYSVLQAPYEALVQFETSWAALSIMIQEANQPVWKMSGLSEAIAAGEGDILRERYKLTNIAKSIVSAVVIDAGNKQDPAESFERQHIQFAGIPDVQDKIMLRLASSVAIPVTILMGQSPAGMNATGESDFRWFYDGLRADQNNYLAPKIRRLNEILLATREAPSKKLDPRAHVIKFPPLWTLDPLQEAERRLKDAQADAARVQSGILLPEESALSRFTPEGYGEDIVLSEEARKAREDGLKAGLDDLARPLQEDEDEPPTPPTLEDDEPVDEEA